MNHGETDDKWTGEAWTWRESLIVAALAAIAVWLIAAFSSDHWSTRLSNAGQALGSIATAVGIGVVVLSLRQLDLQRSSLADQLEASDREFRLRSIEALRRAYAEWFSAADAVLMGLTLHAAFDEEKAPGYRATKGMEVLDLGHEMSKKGNALRLLEVSSPRLDRVLELGGEITDALLDEVTSLESRPLFDGGPLKQKLGDALATIAADLRRQASERGDKQRRRGR